MSKLSFLFWNTSTKEVSAELAELAFHERAELGLTDLALAQILFNPKLTWAEDFFDGMAAMRS